MKNILNTKRGGAFALATLSAGLCLLASAPSARAGLQSQTDTNSLAVASTNTFILNGDVTGSFTNGETPSTPYIVANRGDDLWLSAGGLFTNSTAGASNITFRVAQTVDFVNWTNSATTLTLVVPASSTNWCVVHQLIQNAAPGYGLRAVENANAAVIVGKAGTIYLKGYVKDGI